MNDNLTNFEKIYNKIEDSEAAKKLMDIIYGSYLHSLQSLKITKGAKYFHDLDSFIGGTHNCIEVPNDIFKVTKK